MKWNKARETIYPIHPNPHWWLCECSLPVSLSCLNVWPLLLLAPRDYYHMHKLLSLAWYQAVHFVCILQIKMQSALSVNITIIVQDQSWRYKTFRSTLLLYTCMKSHHSCLQHFVASGHYLAFCSGLLFATILVFAELLNICVYRNIHLVEKEWNNIRIVHSASFCDWEQGGMFFFFNR